MDIRQVEWRGKPAIAIAYVSDKQQVITITMFIIFGATVGICMGLVRKYGLLTLVPIPVVGVVTVDALRQRMFILMDGKRRFLTGVRRGFVFTKELLTIQLVGVREIRVEDTTAKLTQVEGPETGKAGGRRKFHVIATGRSGNHLICSTSNEKTATLVGYSVSKATEKPLQGRVNLSYWRDYIDVLEEEEKEVLKGLVSGRHRPVR